MALTLLPQPRSLTLTGGEYTLAAGRRIVLLADDASTLLLVGQRLQTGLARAGIAWEIAATAAGPADEIGAVLRLAPEKIANAQGYTLTIAADGIVAEAQTPAGLFYAVCTLIQVIEQAGIQLPCLTIIDWPDFAARGVMLDISRDKVPTLETVLELVDMLAGWKINQLQLYTEHTFAYRNHPEVWASASPFTGQDILALDAYCRARFVELVPNQNSFGHMERWLIHDRYASGSKARSASRRKIPAAYSWCAASTTSCCRTSPAACSTSAATRRLTWARAAAKRFASSAAPGASILTSSRKSTRT
jgi:hexosaminidase